MEEMARRTLDFYGRIDILIASAGISAVTSATPGGNSPVAKLSLESWEEIIATNLRGTFLACRAVLRSMMRERRGEILIVSSSLGTALGWAYASAYCASKFAVMGLAEALAQEVQGHGIRVQVVLPDAVDTPMLRKSRLAVRGSLSGEQAAELILELLTAPGDMVCVNPMIEPFGTWEKTGHRKALAG